MKKSLIVEISIVVISAIILGSLVYFKKDKEANLITPCPEDAMMCPDGTSVSRSGSACEFGTCKQDVPSYMEQPQTATSLPPIYVPAPQGTIFSRIKNTIFNRVTETQSTETVPPTAEIKQVPPPAQQNQEVSAPTQPKSPLNEERYDVIDNKLVDDESDTIYGFPAPPGDGGSYVNAIELNEVPPVIDGIPVDGQAGKYYLSENWFGDIEKCEFSNKIYILDTINKTETLMYEENSSTLSADDPRACSSEIYLLATEHEKLILKYHTIGTNQTCDSTWSEPEKTWYLDVTKNEEGTKRYYITPTLYSQAETFETNCRAQLEATTTP